MHKQNNTKRKQRIRYKRVKPTYKGGVPSTVVSAQRALPPSMLIKATFEEEGFLTSGTTTAARQWTPNSFYDCQPATGGNKWNEYDQWSALYTSYRVVSYKYRFVLTNTEGPAYPLHYYILQTDANPGTTVSHYVELSGQKYCTNGSLSIDPVTRFGGTSVDNIVGEKSADFADAYKALMTADPADKVWLSLGCTFSNTVSINGLMYALRIVAYVRLFAPNINTQFLSRPSNLDLEADRLFFKAIKSSRIQKENELIDERIREEKKTIDKLLADKLELRLKAHRRL